MAKDTGVVGQKDPRSDVALLLINVVSHFDFPDGKQLLHNAAAIVPTLRNSIRSLTVAVQCKVLPAQNRARQQADPNHFYHGLQSRHGINRGNKSPIVTDVAHALVRAVSRLISTPVP